MGPKRDNDNSRHYEGVLLEGIFDKVTVIAEDQTMLWDKVDSIDNRLSKVEEDIKIIKLDILIIKQDTKELKQDTNMLKREVSKLKKDMKVVTASLKNMTNDFYQQDRRIKIIEGQLA